MLRECELSLKTKVNLITKYKRGYGLNFCCQAVGVFKSSYYYQHSRTLTIRDKERQEEVLRQKVVEIIEENPSYGYRRLIPELKKQGITVNHKKLLLLLKKWGLLLKRKTVKKVRFGIETILSFLGTRTNIVKRLPEEELAKLAKVVFTDFTEIVYNQGKNKVYFIPYLENVSKKIIGYAVSQNANTQTALLALDRAIKTLTSWSIDITHTIFHQDQGSVFKSYDYVKAIVLKTKALISYSRVGKPEDNPEIESFFGRFKDEWKSVFYQAESYQEINQLISQAITYYNRKRIHSKHKDKSPDEFLKILLKETKSFKH